MIEMVEEECDMEAREASLEAHLASSLLHNDFLVFVSFVFMVKLGDFFQNPEGLSVHLLLEVGGQDVVDLVLLTYSCHSKQVTKGWAVVLDSLVRILNEDL